MKRSLVLLVVGLAVGPPGLVAVRAVDAPPIAEVKRLQPQLRCPIMKGEINKKLFVDYQGWRIYVCCKSCLKQIKQDPAKYIRQLEAEGITLDKAAN